MLPSPVTIPPNALALGYVIENSQPTSTPAHFRTLEILGAKDLFVELNLELLACLRLNTLLGGVGGC